MPSIVPQTSAAGTRGGDSLKKFMPSQRQPEANRRFAPRAAACIAICLLALAAYSNSFGAGFPLDNEGLILRDPRVHADTAENLAAIARHSYWWPTAESGLYRPVTTLTYLLNYAVLGNGTDPLGYHWINWLLHAANTLMVLAVVRRLTSSGPVAAWTAAVWAVHPVLTESVTNIVGRADLLSAAATLGAFWLYVDIRESGAPRPWGRAAALTAITALGVFSKESAVAIAGVILLHEILWWKDRKRDTGMICGCAAVGLAVAAAWWVRAAVLSKSGPPLLPFTDNPILGAGFLAGRLTALTGVERAIALFLWPAHLSWDYSFPAIPVFSGTASEWLALTVVVAAAATVVLLRKHRTALFFAGFALVTFLPASNLLIPIGTIFAERLLYLPFVGAAALLVLGIFHLSGRMHHPRLAPAILGLLAVVFLVRTWLRNPDWIDNRTLAASATADGLGGYKAHKLLAATLYQSGDAHENIDAVIAEAERGLLLLEPLPDEHNQAAAYSDAAIYYSVRAQQLAARGADSRPSDQRALALLQHAAAVRKVQSSSDTAADLDYLLAAIRLRLGDTSAAIAAAERARDQAPLLPERHLQLADALLRASRPDDAAVALMEGMIRAGGTDIREALIQLYRRGPYAACAVASGPNGPAVNPTCPGVHRHICAAAARIIESEMRAGRPDGAARMKKTALTVYSCDAGSLDRIPK